MFSGNRITDISSNPCSSPVHIVSHYAETRPTFYSNPMKINSSEIISGNHATNFPIAPTKLVPQLSGTGDSQRDSHELIRANHLQ